MPKLAVCVPCFNEAPYIEDCLRSISENDLDDIQIYVEDNNSTDGSAEKIEDFLNTLPEKKARHFHLNKRATTVSAGENFKRPLDVTDTPYFMWIGGHDMLTNNFFDLVLSHLRPTRVHQWSPENPWHSVATRLS